MGHAAPLSEGLNRAGGGEKPSARFAALAALALVMLPGLLWLINSEWLYTGISKRDTWSYHAYFIDLPGQLRLHPNDYPSSRLTILLPGWLAYQYLPPALAPLALHALVYLAIVLGLYWTLYRTVGWRPAFLVAALIGLHSFALVGATSNYIDGFGPGFFLVATAAVAEGTEPGASRVWLFVAGCASAALVVSNLVFAILLPVLAVFLAVREGWGTARLLSSLGLAALGMAATLGALGLINVGLGGPFNFLRPSLAFARANAFVTHSVKLGVRAWLPQAGYLVFPVAVGAGGVAWLLARASGGGGKEAGRPAIAFQAFLLALAACLVGLQALPSFSFLQWWYYPVALLLPLAALALGAQWQEALDELSPAGYLAVLLVAAAAGLASFALVQDARPAPILACMALACVGTVGPRFARGPAVLSAALAALAIADWSAACQFCPTDNLPAWEAERVRGLSCRAYDRHRREVHHCVDGAMRIIQRERGDSRCWIWFDNEEPLAELFDRASCVHLCQTWLYYKPRPGQVWRSEELPPGCRVAVLSARSDYHTQVIPELAKYGMTAKVVCQEQVGAGLARCYVTVLEPTPARPGRKEWAP